MLYNILPHHIGGVGDLENNKPGYFVAISAAVRYHPKLKANEKLLAGEIDTLSNKTGWCIASNKYFARLFDTNDKTVSRWIKNLIDQSVVETKPSSSTTRREIRLCSTFKSGVRFYIDGDEKITNGDKKVTKGDEKVTASGDEKVTRGDEKITNGDEKVTEGDEKVTEGGDEKVTHNNLYIINNLLRENLSLGMTDMTPIFVLDYLDEKSPRDDIEVTEESIAMIYELIDQGHCFENFKTVIDKKCVEWIGTPHMEQWLRPQTLFKPHKFKEYLAQAWPAKKSDGSKTQPKGDFSKFKQRDKSSLNRLTQASRRADRRDTNDSTKSLVR